MFWRKKTQISDQQAVQRKREAELLLNNPVLVDAFDALLEDYYTTWLKTKPLDTELREQLYLSTMAIAGVKGKLLEIITSGDMAEHQLNINQE